jgi:hypothetical protein
MRCPDCEVTWNHFKVGPECWVCGQECEPTVPGPAWPQHAVIAAGDAARAHEGERGDR